MTVKKPELKYCDPETVAYLKSLPEERAEKHLPVVHERNCVATQYWRVGGKVRCRDIKADERCYFRNERRARSLPTKENPLRSQSAAASISVGKANTEIAGWAINQTIEAIGRQVPHQLVWEE